MKDKVLDEIVLAVYFILVITMLIITYCRENKVYQEPIMEHIGVYHE